MMPSSVFVLMMPRSVSKIVSTKMMSTGSSTRLFASATAPAVPSCTFCSMNDAGMSLYADRACASTASFKCPVM